MKYQGSKRRLVNKIIPVIESIKRPEQWYVEPFVGGANVIQHVSGKRIGADINKYMIAYLKEIQNGLTTFPIIYEEQYKDIRNNIDKYDEWLVGYAMSSYGFMGNYGTSNYMTASKPEYIHRAVEKMAKKEWKRLQGIYFVTSDYKELNIPKYSFIYCDPPYQSRDGYRRIDAYKVNEFWDWCRKKIYEEGHIILISELEAPDDFIPIINQKLKYRCKASKNHPEVEEKLFMHYSQVHLYEKNLLFKFEK